MLCGLMFMRGSPCWLQLVLLAFEWRFAYRHDEQNAPIQIYTYRRRSKFILELLLLQASLFALGRSPLEGKTHVRDFSRDDRTSFCRLSPLSLPQHRQVGVVTAGKLRRPGAAFCLPGRHIRRHPRAIITSMFRGLYARFLLSGREHQPEAAGMRRGLCHLPRSFRLAHRCR